MSWIIGGIVFVVVFIFTWALCKAASDADDAMGYD